MTREVFIIETICSKAVASGKIDALNRMMSGMLFSDVVEIMCTALDIAIAQHAANDEHDSWDIVLDTIQRKRRNISRIEVKGHA